MNDRLTTGFFNVVGDFTVGQRTFSDEFLLSGTTSITDNPGFNTFGEGAEDLPFGGEPLPADTALEWDWLPMKIDGVVSNLFYWDGLDSVEFGMPPAGHAMALRDKDEVDHPVFATPDLVTGGIINETDGDGLLHEHRDWAVADLSTPNAPADGIYFGALRNRMHNLDNSKPFFVLFSTNGTPAALLADAQAWADTVVDDLTVDFSADFNGDLTVDAADLAILETGFGTVGGAALQQAGDATWDDEISVKDFLELQRQFGSDIAGTVGASSPPPAAAISTVPEPGCGVLIALATGLWGARRPGRSPRA
ncbi:MAG: hypothetical protein AAGA92_04680 [Planctomycetota bacterium]